MAFSVHATARPRMGSFGKLHGVSLLVYKLLNRWPHFWPENAGGKIVFAYDLAFWGNG
jgi:hypothetical protein